METVITFPVSLEVFGEDDNFLYGLRTMSEEDYIKKQWDI